MNKQNKLKLIIQMLLDKGKTTFSRSEIDTAVTKILWVNDQRTRDNWFDLMWKLEFFTQSKFDCYTLNLTEVQRLDVDVKVEKQECLDVNL